MNKGLEELICYHCGPVLAGIKPAGLISIDRGKYPDLLSDLSSLNEQLNNRNLYFKPICSCGKRCMLLVYHQLFLERCLTDSEVCEFLLSLGYPVGGSLSQMISHLENRMERSDGFPHEAGLFLGYPLADVKGFCENRGQNYKLSGYWKVYGDQEAAKRLFQKYTICRNHLCRRVSEGFTITQLFCAA